MTADYLDVLLGAVPEEVTLAAASALGESKGPVEKGLSLCRSTLFSSLLSAFRTPQGQALFPRILDAASESPRLFDLSQLYQGRLLATSLGTSAQSFLSLLFGASHSAVGQRLAQSTGLRPASAASVLQMTAEHLLPALGSRITASGISSPSGLTDVLQAASARLPTAAPSWLAELVPPGGIAAGVSALGSAVAGHAAGALGTAQAAAHDAVAAAAAQTPATSAAAAATAAASGLGASVLAKTAGAIDEASIGKILHPADEILSAEHKKIPVTTLEPRPAAPVIAATAATAHKASAAPAAKVHREPAAAVRPPMAAERREHKGGAGWLYALPAVLLLGTAGWWMWNRSAPVRTAAAPAATAETQQAAAPAAPERAAAEPVEPSKGEPGQTEYYGSTSTFAADVWTNPDYTAAAVSEPVVEQAAAAAVEEALPAPVPGQTEYYAPGEPFTAEVWTNPDYTVAEATAEEDLPPPVPGQTEFYAASEPFTAEVWTNPDYAVAEAAPEPVVEELPPPVPGQTEFYAQSEPFTAEVWTNPDYTPEPAAPDEVAEVLAEPVPGQTEYYAPAEPFTADVWTNPDYTPEPAAPAEVAEVLPEPVPGQTEFYAPSAPFTADVWTNPDYTAEPAAPVEVAEALPEPVPGQTEYYGAGKTFTGEVWTNPDYNKAAAAPPAEAVVKCQNTLNGALSPIRFKTARADLTAEGRKALDKMAEAIKQCPDVPIRVEGHTDSDGATDFNQTLSEARAKAVVGYLAGSGVDAARLRPSGFGELKPIASNEDEAGKSRNRRIDFVVDSN